MFAVYDGHGTEGHACARFARKKLPTYIDKYIRQSRSKRYQAELKKNNIKGPGFDPRKWPFLDADDIKMCCRKGFLECNEKMHDADHVKDKLSGTTATSVIFHGNLLTVCNVGDSRVVLGHAVDPSKDGSDKGGVASGTVSSRNSDEIEEEKTEIRSESGDAPSTSSPFSESDEMNSRFATGEQILAIPLSRDQTPYRKDERERVKKLGAAVMSIDQMEGHEEMHENWGDMVLGEECDLHGDPPRLWLEGKDYPGTAFTRSLGDYLAEDIGVTAEPEILTRQLTSNDRILVVASDGIFEFLTNQEVIDICARCETPIMACQKLVRAAYNEWLVYEKRTDDITVIVLFLTCSKPPDGESVEGTTEDLLSLAKSMYGNKPIRKMPNRDMTVSQYAMGEAVKAALRHDDDNSNKKHVKEDRLARGNSVYRKDAGLEATQK